MKRIKRAIAIGLTAVMFISACPISTLAATTEVGAEDVKEMTSVTGIAEDNVAHGTIESELEQTINESKITNLSENVDQVIETMVTIDESVELNQMTNLTEVVEQSSELISAQSEVADFTYNVLNGTYCEITGYTGSDTEITIPSEIEGYIVQSIANSAFQDNTTLTTVAFPETVETIGSSVFSGCTALIDVRLNDGLTNIGSYTFNGCTALERIVLPGAVTSIGSYAFNGCNALREVSLGEGLTTIKAYAFQNCTSLESIDILV